MTSYNTNTGFNPFLYLILSLCRDGVTRLNANTEKLNQAFDNLFTFAPELTRKVFGQNPSCNFYGTYVELDDALSEGLRSGVFEYVGNNYQKIVFLLTSSEAQKFLWKVIPADSIKETESRENFDSLAQKFYENCDSLNMIESKVGITQHCVPQGKIFP